MDWVEGPSLHELVRKNPGAIDLPQRLGLIAQIAEAVDHLHSGSQTAGMTLLHRDIKPGNVIIHPTRGAVLVDYGLLRVEEPNLTEVPAWTGPYLAPEVHADKTRTSKASDVWAVAATAFFAVTGEHPSPFDAPHMRQQLDEHLAREVSDPSAITDAIMSVLERTPEERPSSPIAWARRLRATLDASPRIKEQAWDSPQASLGTVSRPALPGPRGAPSKAQENDRYGSIISADLTTSPRRRRQIVIAAIALLVLVGAGIGLEVVGTRTPSRSSTTTSSPVVGRLGQTVNPDTTTTTSTSKTTISPSSAPLFSSPVGGSALNNTQGISQAPVLCGYSDPNTPTIFGSGFVGAAEPSIRMNLPVGSTDYFYVGSDAGGNPLTEISWPEDLSVVAGYSGNKSISIGHDQSDSGSYYSGSTTNVAIAGLGVRGYSVLSGSPASISGGTALSFAISNPDSRDVVLVIVGGEGTGFFQLQGAPLQTLVNVTYSECGSNVIAGAGMFAAAVPAGKYTVSLTSTTYGTNSGASLGAMTYLLSPSQ